MQRKTIIFSLLAILLLFPLLAQAATVGKFTNVEGDVDVTAPGQQAVPARLGDPVNVGDIIRTKSKSKCEVTFVDGSVLRLAETSRLRVAEFSQQKEQRSATLNLFRGKIQNIVKTTPGAAGERSKYEVQMPTAVTGVRGTNFFAFFQAGVSGAVFKEGTGYGYSLNRPQEVRSITVGQAMLVTSPDLPPTVRAASSLELNQHERDTTPSEKPKEEGRKDEEKKPETITAKAEEGKKEEQTAPAKAEEKTVEPAPVVASKTEEPTLSAPTITATLSPNTGDLATSTMLQGTDVIRTPASIPTPQSQIINTAVLQPVQNITPKPQPKFVQKPPAITSSNSATVIVSAAEPIAPSITYSYSLDGGTPQTTTGSTITLAGLSDGQHTLEIKAVDLAGNTSEPLTASWTVDTMPPAITLSGKPASITNAGSANIGVVQEEQATLTYTLNGVPVASPNLTNLPEGPNTFIVTATDEAGNTSTDSHTWTVDTKPPALTLSGKPASITNAGSADISVTPDEQATLTYTLNGMPVASPSLTNLPEGPNTFIVTATDEAGNSSTESYYWTVKYSTSLGGGNPVLSEITVGGEIDPQTNQGTMTIAAAAPGGLPAGASGGTTSGVVGDNPYSGFLTLVSGSWEGLLSGIYVTGTGAGYITGDLSGTDGVGSTTLSGSGPVRRTGILGLTEMAPENLTMNLIQLGSVGGEGGVTGFPLPLLGSVNVGGGIGPSANATGELRGLNVIHPDTGRDRMLGVWGVTTSGGTYTNPALSNAWTSVYGQEGTVFVNDHSTPYFLLGQVSGTDDGQGHVSISGDHLTYMERGYIGDISLAYRGKYDPTNPTANYDSAGAGTFTLDPLAFSGIVYGSLGYYGELEGMGSFSQGGSVDNGLLGGTGDLLSGSSTQARLLGVYTSYEAPPYGDFSPKPYLFHSFSPNLSGRTGVNTADTSDDGAFGGYLAGLWNNGSLASAKALTLAIKPAGGGYEAGIVRGDLTGSYYADLRMWEAMGDLTYTSPDAATHTTIVLPDNLASSLNYGDISGSLAGGDVASTIRSGYMQGNLLNISDQAWGIWSMDMGGSYTGTPSGPALSAMGGSIYGYAGDASYSSGYWLSEADLAWNGNTLSGALKNGRFLTDSVTGGISTTYGGIMGTYGDGLWQAVSLGTWGGTELSHVSHVSSDLTGQAIYNTGNYTYADGSYSYEYYTDNHYGYASYWRADAALTSYNITYNADGTYTKTNYSYDATSSSYSATGTETGTWTTASGLSFLSQAEDADNATLSASEKYRYQYYDGNFNALFGGTDTIWTANQANPAKVTMMGTYSPSSAGPHLLGGGYYGEGGYYGYLGSYNYKDGSDTTYDSGAYKGFLVGTEIGGIMDAMVSALYIDPAGDAGYLRGALSGTAYRDIGMFAMDGSVYPTKVASNAGIAPGDLKNSIYTSPYSSNPSLAGAFDTGGKIKSDYDYWYYGYDYFNGIQSMSLANYEANKAAPWGIYSLGFGGTYEPPATAWTSWTAKAGGPGYFGATNVANYHSGSYSYEDGGYYSYNYYTDNRSGDLYYRRADAAVTSYDITYSSDGTYRKTNYSYDAASSSYSATGTETGTWTTAGGLSFIRTAVDSGNATLSGEYKYGVQDNDEGYWLADIKNGKAEGKKLTGNLSGKFITYSKFGTITGDLLGIYNTIDNNWQAVSIGAWSGKPLLYANKIEGDLYQQNKATIHADDYEKPVLGSSMRASTLYVKSQNPANLPGYGWQAATKEIRDSKGFWSDGSDIYYPNNEAFSYRNTNNVPRTSRARLSDLSVRPDFSYSPPTMPWTSEFGVANISPDTYLDNAWPVTAEIPVGTTQYAKTFEQDYALNVMERVLPPFSAEYHQTFQGIMGAYQLDGGLSNLWATDSTHPLGLTFVGEHQEATLPLVFSLRRFFSQNYAVSGASPALTPDGGAYLGFLAGTLASDGSLDAALSALYVSPTTDGQWEAGILKTTAPLTGASGAGAWEADGRFYRDPKAENLSTGVDAGQFVEQGYNSLGGPSFVNIRRGNLGDASLQSGGLYGRFGTSGAITTLAGAGFGNTLSIAGLPDFGIFEMHHGGLENTYSNPAAGATWRMDMASTGQFGQYVRSDLSNYSDSGFWIASIDDGALSAPDKLSGTLSGYFLTYKKEGTLTGDFLGNLKPDVTVPTTGIWQGASVGAWEKTRDVTFASGIVGDNFRLQKQIRGDGGMNNSYTLELNSDGSYRWANAVSASGLIISRRNFEIMGPPGQEEYSETTWIEDNTDPFFPVYTLQAAKKLTLAEFNNAIDALRTEYQASPYNYSESTDNYWMGQNFQHDGIFAGFDNLWNTTGGVKATNVSMIGKYEGDDRGTPTVFGGTIVSFDPLYSMNPYYNSTSNPNGSRSPLGGAYYGYLGAVYGKQTVAADWVDGLMNGLYRDPSGNVGILTGKFTGNNNPQVGAWAGTGLIDGGYAMGTASSSLTEAYFANAVILGRRDWSYGTSEVTLLTGDNVSLRAMSSNSATIANNWLNPSGIGFWGVWQNRAGGTFSGTPAAWTWEAKMVDGSQTDYLAIQLDATEVKGVKTGHVVGAGVRHDNYPSSTVVIGGTMKGLFDPVKSTWQAVSQGTVMETAAFLTKINSMTDAQRQAFTDATLIPAFTVGTTDLRGSGSAAGGAVNLGNATDASKGVLNATFLAPSTGGNPQIWASGNVTGAYAGTPTGVTVGLSGYAPGGSTANGISANFNIQQWTGTKWGATVTSGSVPPGTAGFNYPNAATTGIAFQGGAAGSINPTAGTFSGTAAGVVK